ncbi:MAG: IPT/TIG domain-containing protein, partial [Actinomycetota bacterium]|nr:IPT/TIG domain-containing protein [Actinomycetota bacterium]
MRKSRSAGFLSFLVCLSVVAMLLTGCGAKKGETPSVIALSCESGKTGTKVDIIGSNFGDSQGDSVVHVGSKVAEVLSWRNDRITITIPEGLDELTYPVSVLTEGGESNYVEFTVIAKAKKPAQPERKEGQVEHITAAQAMIAWMKQNNIDPNGFGFSIAQI